MQQLHEKIADMNSCYYDLRGKIVKAERRIAILTERGEMWEQYNQYKSIHKQLAKVKPEKREQFEQRHSRELILYDAAARYLKELKGQRRGNHPQGMAAGNRPAGRWKADGHACHEIHEGGFESSGTAPQNRRAAVPTGTGQVSRPGAGAVKATALCRTPRQGRRVSRPTFAYRKTAVQVSPYGGSTVYLPNRSLCVPVRASVSTRTSSSMR